MRALLKILRTDDLHAAIALVYTGLLLTAFEFYGLPHGIQKRLDQDLPRHLRNMGVSLDAGLWWSGACLVGYLVIPALLILFVQRQPLRLRGFSGRGFIRHVWVYLGLYALMLPAIFWAAGQGRFLATYPFVNAAQRDFDVFIRWEIAYVLQFFALEAFFRGYLLFTLERRMGSLAAFVMAVPYAMIHFHKPPAEAFGALFAGIFLGALALRFRSWFGGALLHSLVAITMDILAVRKAGLF